MKSMLIPSLVGIGVPLVVNLVVFPQFMFFEFNRLLVKVCKGIEELYENLFDLHFSNMLSPNSDAWVSSGVFNQSQALFQLADRLPALLSIANMEGAWSFTNLGAYQNRVLEPLMQLTYNVCYSTRVLTRFQSPLFCPEASVSETVAYRGKARILL